MASHGSPVAGANEAPPNAASPPAAQLRARQVFDHARKSLERGDYEYAHDLFTQCVAQQPGVLAYLQHFRANVAQMHPALSQPGGAKKPGGFGLRNLSGGKSGVAKAAAKGAWEEAFTAGCHALKKAPTDTQTLCEMADACGELGHTDCQLYYLRWAMDLAPADADINRAAAAVLESINEYDQAISCWNRVLAHKPGDEEAEKAISRLTVEKTIDDGGYNPALLSGAAADVAAPALPRVAQIATSAGAPEEAPPAATDGDANRTADEASPADHEARLRAAIDADPQNANAYTALAEYCDGVGRLQDAERLYRKAIDVADGADNALLEKLEDVYLRRMRERAAKATRRAEKEQSASAAKVARQAYDEANRAEVEVFEARAARAPDDPRLQFDLGLRLKRVGRHRDAVAPLQAARADERRLAEVHLHLGESFQHIEQHKLAMRSYEDALRACGGGDWNDLRKLACYRAGVLALGMGELETAENHLTELAAADFGYRDVAERLDKIARIRNAK